MTLTDHVAPITDLAFTRDDCGLVTSSNDGSVYSWIVGAKSRDKEFVKKGYAVTHVCVGKNQGCKTIIASFESVVAGGESTVPLANDVVRRRRQSSIAIRRSAKATNDRSSSRDFTALNNALRGSRGEALRGSRESKVSERSSNGGSQDLGPALAAFSSALNRPDGSPPGSPPIMGSPVATNKPFSSGDNSPGSAGNNATGNLSNTVSPFRQAVFTGATSAYTPSNIQKQAFLAVWEGEISSNPTIIQLPAVVKAIQLGRSSGPDSFDLCVIALADGQIILSMLPLPLMSLNDGGIPPPSAGPKVVNFSTGANIEHKRLSMAMIRMAPTKRSVNAGILAAVSEDDGGGGGTISSGMDNASRAAGGGYATTSADDASQSSTSISEDGFRSRANSVLPNASTGINLAPSASPTSTAIAETPSSSSSDAVHHLNISQCRVLRLIVGGCSQIQFSPDGAWIFLGGQDGSVFLLSTMRKFAELPHHAQSQQQQQQSVEMQHRNELSKLQFLMVERTKMEGIRTKLIEMEHTLEQSQKDHELYIGKILEGREKLLLDLEAKMKREIVSRDETILQARNDYFQLKRSSAEELASLRKHCDESLSALELMYERRLAQEGVYLDKLKQAYDEYVVNLKMDMTSVQGQVETKMQAIEQEKHKVIVEAEKQKMAILNYYDYIKRRNEEVIASLEEQQSEERSKLKQQLAQTHAMLADAQAKNMSSEVQANHTISKLKVEIENKEVEILRVNSDLEWANDRIAKLENALQQATMELKARAELNEKWEGKAGEMTKRIEDLEKIRKTLTNQLHGLRDELAPKDDELHKAAEKLQEMDREYEISLHAITEKEKALAYKSQNLTLLQKQVRDLRKQASQKDVALRRSAVLLEEFIYSMHEVRFKPKSVGVNAAGNAIMGTAAGGDVAAITIPTALPVNSAAPTPMAADNGHKSRMNSIMPAAHSTLQHAALAALGAVNTNTSSTAAAPPTAAGVPSTASDPMENGANTSGKGQRTNQLSQPHSHDLIAALKLDNNVNLKLRRLNDVLKPYLTEGDVEAEIVDDIEQVRREQDRHMTLLHRNFSSLQSSLDTAQQVLNYKVHNHLTDNQTLLKEVNQLRSEVKSLSLENQRLAAQLEFMNARRQEQINAFNAQFLSTNSDIPPNAGLLGMAGVETSEPQSGRPLSQGRGGLNSTISMPSTPAVVFPALMPPGPIDAIGNARLAGSLSNKKTALFGSSSQPILSTMQSADPAVGREKSSREKALTPAGLGMSSAGSIGSASGTGSRRGQKPMKSIEELLDPTVASNSTAQTPTINPAPRMTADEKVARLVELNFQEIRATNSATATGASTPASATPNASTTSTRSQRKR